jgi:hypothetical protein
MTTATLLRSGVSALALVATLTIPAAASPPATIVAAASATATNLLANPNFSGPLISYTVDHDADGAPSHFGTITAANWNWWAATYHTVTADILPSALPGHQGETMLHFTSDSVSSDINQEFCAYRHGPAHGQFSIWVYPVAGGVTAAVGDGGGPGGGHFSTDHTTVTGRWQQLTGPEQSGPLNEFNVRPYDPTGTVGYFDFYATAASVTGSNGETNCGS